MATEEQFPFVRPARGQSQGEPTATYVNGVAIIVSPWDFSLLFSRALASEPLSDQSEARPGATPGARQLALQAEVVQRLVMSPEHAKAMAVQLAENVALFESEFGPIPAPSAPETRASGKTQITTKASEMNAGPFRSAGGTGPSGATGPSGPVVGTVAEAREEPWQAWLRTAEARNYDGEWVLLNANARPIDSDLSPTALANRHTPTRGQIILFVEAPPGVYTA